MCSYLCEVSVCLLHQLCENALTLARALALYPQRQRELLVCGSEETRKFCCHFVSRTWPERLYRALYDLGVVDSSESPHGGQG